MIKRLMQGAGAMHPSEWHLIISKRSITFLCVSLFALRKEYLPPNITIRESIYVAIRAHKDRMQGLLEVQIQFWGLRDLENEG